MSSVYFLSFGSRYNFFVFSAQARSSWIAFVLEVVLLGCELR